MLCRSLQSLHFVDEKHSTLVAVEKEMELLKTYQKIPKWIKKMLRVQIA